MTARLLLALVFLTATARADSYEADVAAWRAAREADLRAEDGWLTVAGLFWLADGTSHLGTGADNGIVLPAGSAPARAGVLAHHGAVTTITLEGAAAKSLRANSDDVVALGRLSFTIIQRGGRYALRLRDRDSPQRKEFTGLTWYPVRRDARVTAKFVAAPSPRTLSVPNVVGQTVPMASPGRVVFTLGGREVGLDAVLEEPDAKELFFIFADATTGAATYPGGRFLHTPLPVAGAVVLDFNEAYSPPCAFTAFATCPLPPPQNRLPVAVEAGEKYVVK